MKVIAGRSSLAARLKIFDTVTGALLRNIFIIDTDRNIYWQHNGTPFDASECVKVKHIVINEAEALAFVTP